MKRRLISFLLAFVMILTLLPAQAFAVDEANPFRDVEQGDWCYDAVQYVRINGLFNGTTPVTFRPNDAMTRGMFVTVLGRMAGVNPDDYAGPSAFTDVPEREYFAPYVAWASKYGITAGTGNGRFSPYDPINRQQMAAFFVRYFETFGVDYETGANVASTPADLDSISEWAREAVLKLWKQGLLNGDGVNFNPQESATRAQAAAICYRADEAVETWYSAPGVPSGRVRLDPATGRPYGEDGSEDGGARPEDARPSSGGNPGGSSTGSFGNDWWDLGGIIDGNGGNPGSGDTTTTFYEVRFLAGSGQGEMELPETKTYAAGTRIDRLPTPFGMNRVFLGWYYDEALTQPAAASETLSRNVTLYAKMADLEGGGVPQLETPNYVTAADASPDFVLKLSGAYQQGDLTIIDVTANNETVEFTVGADGTVTVAGGWIPGHTYKAELNEDSTALFEYQGAVQSASVRVFNLIIKKDEVENLKLDDGVKYIPKENVSGMTDSLDGLFQISLTQDAEGETQRVEPVAKTGSFTYAGEPLAAGDIVAIYEGVRPDERTLATDNDGMVAYVEIIGVTGTTYDYRTAETDDVVFTPDILPVSADRKTGNSLTLTRNEFANGNYKAMGLDANTTVDVGDYIAFYTGSWDGSGALDSYGEITAVTETADGYAVTYTDTTEAAVMASMDLYSTREQEIELTDEQIRDIEDSIMAQAEESGFLDEAAAYLTSLAMETDGFQELSDDFSLQKTALSYSSGRAKGPTIKSKSITPKVIVGKLDHFEDSKGVRVELEMKLEIEVGKITIDMTAIFEQEVLLSVNTSGGAVWKKAWIFPYIYDYRLNANFDVGTYTGIGITATAKTSGDDEPFNWKPATGLKAEEKILNIGKQITDLMKDKEKFMSKDLLAGDDDDDDDDDDGGIPISGGLTEKYAAMIEDADDTWVELFRKEIFSAEGSVDPFHILCYGISADFVVSANMYVTLGVTFDYGVAKRYNFSLTLFHKNCTNETIDLETAHYQLSAYVMGTLGVRAGIEFEIAIGLFSLKLDSIGICAEAGVYAQLWGYFYYELKWEKGQGKDSYYAGALLIEIGAYLKISFKAQLFSSDKLTYQPTLYENQWPVLTIGEPQNVFDFIDLDAGDLSYDIFSTTRDFLSSDIFTMKYLDMQTGKLGGVEDEDTGVMAPGRNCDDATESHFTIEFSDPDHFRYEADTNSIVVTPGNTVSLETTMTIRWKDGTLALTSRPLVRTLNITWQDPENARYYSFDSRGGSRVRTIARAAGESFDWPADPSKVGYDFGGWYTSDAFTDDTLYTARPTTMPDHEAETGEKGITLYARWIPRTDTKYTVEHYCQSVNGIYELTDTDQMIGTTDDPTAAAVKTTGEYVHFTSKPFQQTSIAPDGSAVVKIYYNRNSYTVQFTFGDRADDNHQPTVYTLKYGATVYAPHLEVKGFSLTNFPGFPLDLETGGAKVTGDAVYNATWEARGDTPYKVEHYLQKADGSGYELKNTEYKEGFANQTATAQPGTYAHFAVNSEAEGSVPSGIPTTDGALTLKLYYDREKVTVTFDPNGGTMTETTREFLWGAAFQEPTAPTREDYGFEGWYNGDVRFTGTVTEPVTLTARWKAGAVNYTAEHYIMDTVGQYPAAASYTSTVSGTAGETVTLASLKNAAYETDGCTFDSAKTAESAVIAKGMTVKLYYQRAQHTLTWVLDGGTLTSDAPTAVYHGAAVTTPTATKNGYKLTGWYADSNFTGEKLGSTFTASADATYYAKWEVQQAVPIQYYGPDGTTPLDEWTLKDQIQNYADLPTECVPGATLVTALANSSEFFSIGWCTDPNERLETLVTAAPESMGETLRLYMVALVQTESNIFSIGSPEDMVILRKIVAERETYLLKGYGLTFKLQADLMLPEDWEPIGGSDSLKFLSDFDGQNHTIQYYQNEVTNEWDQDAQPIFGYADVGTIKNLNVTVGNIHAINRHGWGAIAQRQGGAIENCHVSGGRVTVTGQSEEINWPTMRNEHVGGLAGYCESMTNCTAGEADNPLVLINESIGGTYEYDPENDGAPTHTGGLVGRGNGFRFTNPEANGTKNYAIYTTVKGHNSSGGLAGWMTGDLTVDASVTVNVVTDVDITDTPVSLSDPTNDQTFESKLAAGAGGLAGHYAGRNVSGIAGNTKEGTVTVSGTVRCSKSDNSALVGGAVGKASNTTKLCRVIIKDMHLVNNSPDSKSPYYPQNHIVVGYASTTDMNGVTVGANCTINGTPVKTGTLSVNDRWTENWEDTSAANLMSLRPMMAQPVPEPEAEPEADAEQEQVAPDQEQTPVVPDLTPEPAPAPEPEPVPVPEPEPAPVPEATQDPEQASEPAEESGEDDGQPEQEA